MDRPVTTLFMLMSLDGKISTVEGDRLDFDRDLPLVREGLVDFVDVVVAPLFVGGRDTPTLVDGPSFTSVRELSSLCPLELLSCEALRDSYVRLRYRVAQPSQDYA